MKGMLSPTAAHTKDRRISPKLLRRCGKLHRAWGWLAVSTCWSFIARIRYQSKSRIRFPICLQPVFKASGEDIGDIGP